MELEFTGERVVPGIPGDLKYETEDAWRLRAVRQERRTIDSIEDRQRMLALGLKEAHL